MFHLPHFCKDIVCSLARQAERFPNPLDQSHVSIWQEPTQSVWKVRQNREGDGEKYLSHHIQANQSDLSLLV